MKIIRLKVNGDNLYRFSGRTHCGWPQYVEAFQKEPAARRVLGRWYPCPNVNVARQIAREIA